MQNKGFTLVELIVVITILAILGTIAFISLQGYGAEAKNSKVTSDLRNLVSAIETKRTRDSGVTLGSLASSTSLTGSNGVDSAATVASTSSHTGIALSATGVSYDVANIDFSSLGQNGDDFKDPNGGNDRDYLYAYTTGINSFSDEAFGYYQLAGQIIDNDVKKVRVNGSYVVGGGGSDTVGLISQGTNATVSTAALSNDDTLTIDVSTVASDLY